MLWLLLKIQTMMEPIEEGASPVYHAGEEGMDEANNLNALSGTEMPNTIKLMDEHL